MFFFFESKKNGTLGYNYIINLLTKDYTKNTIHIFYYYSNNKGGTRT